MRPEMAVRTRPLGELVDFLDGRRVPVKSADRRSGPYPYYGASGIVDWVDDFLFEGLHLLVSEDGENLRSRSTPVAFLADGRFWVNNHAHVLVGNSEGDTRFLAYALESADISGFLTGSAQPKLSQSSLSSVPIVAPSLTEQRAIAEVLGALDDKIAANDRLIGVACRLMTALASQSAVTVAVRELAQQSRASVNPSDLGETVVQHYSLPAFDASTLPSIEPAMAILSGKFVVRRPAVLLSKLNPRFPRVWDLPQIDGTALSSTEFVVLHPYDVTTSVLWAVLSQPGLGQSLVDKASGTSGSHQRVRPQEIMDAEVPDPRALSESAQTLITATGRRVHHAREEAADLAALRDALLPELMSGRMRVKDAGRDVEEVL